MVEPAYMEDPAHHRQRVREFNTALEQVSGRPEASEQQERMSHIGLASLFQMPTVDQ